jgi:uncharacterized protein YozE (UPF0346 family)
MRYFDKKTKLPGKYDSVTADDVFQDDMLPSKADTYENISNSYISYCRLRTYIPVIETNLHSLKG